MIKKILTPQKVQQHLIFIKKAGQFGPVYLHSFGYALYILWVVATASAPMPVACRSQYC
jgi:hypothetical protein